MVFCLMLLALGFGAQSDTTVFRAGVSLVRVDAQVTQGDRIISTLNKEDFVVFDNGVPQPIVYFRQEEDPLDLLLVLDTSGSMRKAMQSVSRAAHQALKQLRPSDRVGIARFALNPVMIQPLTEDRSKVEKAIEVIGSRPFGGGTNIHGALEHGGTQLQAEPRSNRRRAILIITDGVGVAMVPRSTTLRRLWEADAVVSALLVKGDNPKFSPRALRRSVDVPDLVDQTGGESLKSNSAGEGFKQILERIRRRYSLYYALPTGEEGELRTTRVEVADAVKKRYKGVSVRARKGYVWRIAGQ
jgi:Ca-activated chloride channel family protein